jgi:hypothetical protein
MVPVSDDSTLVGEATSTVGSLAPDGAATGRGGRAITSCPASSRPMSAFIAAAV